MAIINMIENEPHFFDFRNEEVVGPFTPVYPEGTYAPKEWNGENMIRDGKRHVILVYSWAHGRVLSDHERNGRDDSDFYCYYWDDASESIKVCEYASTRGWTYPCYGTAVDATPEIKEKADAWQHRQDRARRARQLQGRRRILRELRATTGYTVPEFRRLMRGAGIVDPRRQSVTATDASVMGVAFGIGDRSTLESITLHRMVDEIRKLHGGSHRSKFRISLAQQIEDWVKTPDHKYDSPLSPKQMRCL